MGKYFGTDGVRGVANVDLTAAIAFKIGRFIGNYGNKRNKIIIARDTRISGEMLAFSVISGILASGSEVFDLSVSTTPSISYIVEKFDFDYGIMISASHNPYYDNGIKIFNKEGEKLECDIEEVIEKYIDSYQDVIEYKKNEQIGKYHYDQGFLKGAYTDFLKTKAHDITKFKVLVDCANGSASSIVPKLFFELGITADYICNEPTGVNINNLCGATHLETLQKAMIASDKKYDLGLAFDGDADRLMLVSPRGEIINGDHMIYLNAVDMKREGKLKENTVVMTVMSNLGLKKALIDEGITFHFTQVGDKYVQHDLKERQLSLGGEQSGHVIFLDDLNTGDGIITAIKVLNIMKKENKTIDELVSKMKIFPQVLENFPVLNKEAIMANTGLQEQIAKYKILLGENGRLLVRPSGTEQLIRVMVECAELSQAQMIVDFIIKYIKNISY